jgi:hypothetical protein
LGGEPHRVGRVSNPRPLAPEASALPERPNGQRVQERKAKPRRTTELQTQNEGGIARETGGYRTHDLLLQRQALYLQEICLRKLDNAEKRRTHH